MSSFNSLKSAYSSIYNKPTAPVNEPVVLQEGFKDVVKDANNILAACGLTAVASLGAVANYSMDHKHDKDSVFYVQDPEETIEGAIVASRKRASELQDQLAHMSAEEIHKSPEKVSEIRKGLRDEYEKMKVLIMTKTKRNQDIIKGMKLASGS